MLIMYGSHNKQSGVASIFTVIFFALLISIIVISFVTIVNQDQRQSTNADLSASAYDSAQAGVEDAKRGLEVYNSECKKVATPGINCDLYRQALSSNSCNAIVNDTTSNPAPRELAAKLGITADADEAKVETDTNDTSLDQAYTCLKVQLETDNYEQSSGSNQNVLVQLKTVNNDPFSHIYINWYTKGVLDIPDTTTKPLQLPKDSTAWGVNRPPVMRAQVIAVPRGSTIDMDQVDRDTKTVFMYPSRSVAHDLITNTTSVNLTTADVGFKTPKNGPREVYCDPNADTDVYSCRASIENFVPAGGGDFDYYLLVTPLYSGTDFEVRLTDGSLQPDGSNTIKFDGIEPRIDSTGRANDVFRRVVSRVIFSDESQTTNGGSGFDVTQGICKGFELADDATKWYIPQNCGKPASGSESLVGE